MTSTELLEIAQRLVLFVKANAAPEFPARYRPGAPRTARFGLDSLNGQFRLHLGVDASRNSDNSYAVYAPFAISRCEYLKPMESFGSLLRLWVEDADFEIRIAHMDDVEMSEQARWAITTGEGLAVGTLIGYAGQLGEAFGRHTHTEIVSVGNRSDIIEFVLLAVYGAAVNVAYGEDELQAFYERHFQQMMDYRTFQDKVKQQYEQRSISWLNKYLARKRDYLDRRPVRSWYNSLTAFCGM